MSQSDQRPKVTVEDLLRLKRAERPAAEFWTHFEHELRQKQLTALLKKRPWWRDLPQILARRAYLPVGITVMLAFTLISVKYYAPARLAQVAVSPTNSPVNPDDGVVTPTATISPSLVNRSESAPVETALAAMEPAAGESSSEAVELMPLPAGPRETEKPSARLLAANLAGLAENEAGFGQDILNHRLSAPARVQTAALAAEELASVPVNSTHRNRLLARYEGRQLSPEPAPPAVVRERLARRLGDAGNTDRDSRLARDIDSFGTSLPQIVAFRF